MNGAAVGTGDNINTISIHIACNAAHVPDDGFFLSGIPCSDPLFYEATVFPRTGGQNIAAAVDTGRNGSFPAEIAGDTAYIVRAADVIFLIGGIGNTGIHCTPDDAAHVASRVVGIAVFCVSAAAYIAGILYVGNLASAGSRTGNAACIGNIDRFRPHAIIGLTIAKIMCSMIFIISGHMSLGGHISAVFCILHSGICHGADNAAHIIQTAHIQAVINKIVFVLPAESRIGCFSHKAAHIGALAGNAAQVIARAGQCTSRKRTNEAACIIFSPLCRAGNSPGIDQIFKNRIPCRSDEAAHVGTAGDGRTVRDIADLRAALYRSGQSAHIRATGDAAAYEGDILNHGSTSNHAEKTDVILGISVDIQIENIVIQPVEFAGK